MGIRHVLGAVGLAAILTSTAPAAQAQGSMYHHRAMMHHNMMMHHKMMYHHDMMHHHMMMRHRMSHRHM